MGGQKNRAPVFTELRDHILDDTRVHRIQPVGHLIQEEDLRLVDHGAHKVQPDLHALGVLTDPDIAVFPQPHAGQKVFDVRGLFVEALKKLQVFHRGQLGEVHRHLKAHADALIIGPAGFAQVFSQAADGAFIIFQ